MKVIFSNVSPPIPVRNCDWSASLDDDENALRGWGATKVEALNDLLENEDVDVIAKHFNITTQYVDPCRGPEDGHWVAISDSDMIAAPWRDQAIVDLAFRLAGGDA